MTVSETAKNSAKSGINDKKHSLCETMARLW